MFDISVYFASINIFEGYDASFIVFICYYHH